MAYNLPDEFDLVVYTGVQNYMFHAGDFGEVRSSEMPMWWEHVSARYRPDEILFLDGDDLTFVEADDIENSAEEVRRRIWEYAAKGVYFRRELQDDCSDVRASWQ